VNSLRQTLAEIFSFRDLAVDPSGKIDAQILHLKGSASRGDLATSGASMVDVGGAIHRKVGPPPSQRDHIRGATHGFQRRWPKTRAKFTDEQLALVSPDEIRGVTLTSYPAFG
jgi:hypothetical protein